MTDRARIAFDIANEIGGPIDSRSSKTKRQNHDNLFRAALLGIEAEEGERIEQLIAAAGDDTLKQARIFAAQSLMARMVRAPAEKRDRLKGRVALIRAHKGDETPEVRSAVLAIEVMRALPGDPPA